MTKTLEFSATDAWTEIASGVANSIVIRRSGNFRLHVGTVTPALDTQDYVLVDHDDEIALTSFAAGDKIYLKTHRPLMSGGDAKAVVITADQTAPVLSVPVDTKTGGTTGTGSATTTEGNGTLYWVLSSLITAPSAAQIRAGQMNTGAAALKSGSQPISIAGAQAIAFSGLTSETTHYMHCVQDDRSGNASNVVSGDGFVTDDITGPLLSLPVDTAASATTGAGSVTTNTGAGVLYFVVTLSALAPTAAQVKAGLNAAGAAAVMAGSQAVSISGAQAISGGFTGLVALTQYFAHYVHEDVALNPSLVASGDGFTTTA